MLLYSLFFFHSVSHKFYNSLLKKSTLNLARKIKRDRYDVGISELDESICFLRHIEVMSEKYKNFSISSSRFSRTISEHKMKKKPTWMIARNEKKMVEDACKTYITANNIEYSLVTCRPSFGQVRNQRVLDWILLIIDTDINIKFSWVSVLSCSNISKYLKYKCFLIFFFKKKI